MPNWTTNFVRISGDKKLLDKVLKELPMHDEEHGTYALTSIVPMPETYLKYDTTNYPDGKNLQIGKPASWSKNAPIVTEELIEEYKQATKEQREKYGTVGWYDWNCKYLGCKWDAEFSLNHSQGDLITDVFDTPWRSPDKAFIALSKKYPELRISMFSHYEDNANEILFFNDGYCKKSDCYGEGYYKQLINSFGEQYERKISKYLNEDWYNIAVIESEGGNPCEDFSAFLDWFKDEEEEN